MATALQDKLLNEDAEGPVMHRASGAGDVLREPEAAAVEAKDGDVIPWRTVWIFAFSTTFIWSVSR
jgi:hypothetical protein